MIKKTLLIILLSCYLLNIQSAPIDINTASKVAGTFIKNRAEKFITTHSYSSEIKEIIPLYYGEVVAYAINLAQGGFVIVAADNVSKPVLGYSFEGSFMLDQMPPVVEEWMENYYRKIIDLRQNNIQATPEIEMEWSNLIKGEFPDRDLEEVAPLLSTTWDQGMFYNELCPADEGGPGGHVYSGCVATAMAQIINYWRYPLSGTGSHGYHSDYGYLFVDFSAAHYDYNQMNNSIASERNYEMAEIQYHCGVAVDMMYSPDGSGAYSYMAATALKNHFGYSPNLMFVEKQDYSEENWVGLLTSNLLNGLPIYYHGFGSGGHAFNVDGFQGADYFHFNWGWSGSFNGYFYLSSLNPGGYDFTYGQGAIVNFVPESGDYPYYCSGVTTLTRHNGTIEDGSGPINNYISGLNCGWLIAPEDSISGLILTFEKFNLAAGDVVNIFDGENSSYQLIGTYTGTSLPPEISSSSGKLFLEFLTNGDQGSGFRASYKSTLVNYCPGITTLTDAMGTLADGSGPRNYRDKSICKYKIVPENAATITISFDEFDVEPVNDKLRIYDLVSQSLVAELSGNDLPDDVVVPSGKAYIMFVTNDSVTGAGWQITYSSTITDVDDIEPENRKVHLYCSPNPADEWLRIDVRTTLNENLKIELISADGKVNQVFNGVPPQDSFTVTENICTLKPGLYILRYLTDSETAITKIVIK